MNPSSSICLICPRSCALNPSLEDNLPGQKLCPRGKEFLENERNGPKRFYFSTIRNESGELVPFRTSEQILLVEIVNFTQALGRASSVEERRDLLSAFIAKFPVTFMPGRKGGSK